MLIAENLSGVKLEAELNLHRLANFISLGLPDSANSSITFPHCNKILHHCKWMGWWVSDLSFFEIWSTARWEPYQSTIEWIEKKKQRCNQLQEMYAFFNITDIIQYYFLTLIVEGVWGKKLIINKLLVPTPSFYSSHCSQTSIQLEDRSRCLLNENITALSCCKLAINISPEQTDISD